MASPPGQDTGRLPGPSCFFLLSVQPHKAMTDLCALPDPVTSSVSGLWCPGLVPKCSSPGGPSQSQPHRHSPRICFHSQGPETLDKTKPEATHTTRQGACGLAEKQPSLPALVIHPTRTQRPLKGRELGKHRDQTFQPPAPRHTNFCRPEVTSNPQRLPQGLLTLWS